MLIREKAVAAVESFDFLLGPTSPITAYAADEPAPGADPRHAIEHWSFTAPFNMSRNPTLSLPCGSAPGGPPPSLQLIARELGEATLLQAGAAFESATPWHEQRPPV